MADKSVERIDPPFPEQWDLQAAGGDDVAYVMVYTHVDDKIESISFNRTGAELGRTEGDFRRGSASWKLKEAPKPAEHAAALAPHGKTLPDPEPRHRGVDMPTTLDLTGLDHTLAALRLIQHLDATALMLSWMKILEDDNRKGIMAGLDHDGVPMVPVTYRPAPTLSLGRVHRRKQAYNPGIRGNLTSSEYRRLDGPPLAPRGAGSRSITNFMVDYDQLRSGMSGLWQVTYWWEDVVNVKGNPFLRFHFTGSGRLPRRDLRGLRPEGRAKAQKALQAWGQDQIRIAFGTSRQAPTYYVV